LTATITLKILYNLISYKAQLLNCFHLSNSATAQYIIIFSDIYDTKFTKVN